MGPSLGHFFPYQHPGRLQLQHVPGTAGVSVTGYVLHCYGRVTSFFSVTVNFYSPDVTVILLPWSANLGLVWKLLVSIQSYLGVQCFHCQPLSLDPE